MRPRIALTGIKKESFQNDVEDLKKRGYKILAADHTDSKQSSVMMSLEQNLFFKLILGNNLEVRSQASYSYEVVFDC